MFFFAFSFDLTLSWDPFCFLSSSDPFESLMIAKSKKINKIYNK